MQTFILIMFLATSSDYKSGTGGISQEFNTKETCEIAGKALVDQAQKRNNFVLTYGCFKK